MRTGKKSCFWSTNVGISRQRQGKVKVVNALATFHKILDDISPDGTVFCKMKTTESNTTFVFSNNGIEIMLRIQEGGNS